MGQCISIDIKPMASVSATITSLSGVKASIAGKSVGARIEGIGGGLRPSLVPLHSVSASMKGRGADPMLVTYCPVDYRTSAQGTGGWNDDLGWDDNIGWKD